jgi:predicted metal-dependent peptidase
MSSRPDKISKLAIYAQEHEPLLYLFIINSDFIEDDGTILGKLGYAGVGMRNKRIKFFYRPRILTLPREQLFFLMLHEAYHIFKRHLTNYKDLHKINPNILNQAQDMVINEELSTWRSDQVGITPKLISTALRVEQEFKNQNRKLGNQSYTTRRLFEYLINKKIKKEDLLQNGNYVKIKDTDTYGQITSDRDNGENGNYNVETMSKEEFEEELMSGTPCPNRKKKVKFHKDVLIPVVRGGVNGDGNKIDFEVEVIDPIDTHIENNEIEEVEIEVLAKKIFEQAKDMAAQRKRAGQGGGRFLNRIEELYKSKVNWKRELNKHLNIYYSNHCKTLTTRKSFVTYPWNPKSRYGILCKHTIEEVGNKQKYIIIAIDTSGSVFYDKKEMATFFTEIEAMAKWFEFTREGTILSVQWDGKVEEGLQLYQKNDWKKFGLKGGGGTIPHALFNYFDKTFIEKNGRIYVNENGINFIVNNKKELPFVVVLTDGYFYGTMKTTNYGIYRACPQNVLFFTKTNMYMSKKMKKIIYEN